MSDLLEAIDYVIGKDDYNTYRPIEVLSDGINFIDNVETQEIGFLPNSDILSIILKPDGLIIIQSLQSEVERLREKYDIVLPFVGKYRELKEKFEALKDENNDLREDLGRSMLP